MITLQVGKGRKGGMQEGWRENWKVNGEKIER